VKYLVLIKRVGANFFASSPDVPLCFATGDTIEETRDNFSAALRGHLASLRETGDQVPEPETIGEYLTVD